VVGGDKDIRLAMLSNIKMKTLTSMLAYNNDDESMANLMSLSPTTPNILF
jgi:hypothetical protein